MVSSRVTCAQRSFHMSMHWKCIVVGTSDRQMADKLPIATVFGVPMLAVRIKISDFERQIHRFAHSVNRRLQVATIWDAILSRCINEMRPSWCVKTVLSPHSSKRNWNANLVESHSIRDQNGWSIKSRMHALWNHRPHTNGVAKFAAKCSREKNGSYFQFFNWIRKSS